MTTLVAAVALFVCIPRGWVSAADSTGDRGRATEMVHQGSVALFRAAADPSSTNGGRPHAAELSDSAAQDAASTGDSGPAEPTRVALSETGLAGDGPDRRSRTAGGSGGSMFGFDFFVHLGERPPTRPDEGLFLRRHLDGGIAIEGLYENGEREGEWSSYYPDGSLRLDGQYVDGKRVGRWKAYHPSGETMGEGEYNAGLREGEWVLYYSNGLMKEHGYFEHDLRNGPWQFYDGFGELEARSGYYRYGRLLTAP